VGAKLRLFYITIFFALLPNVSYGESHKEYVDAKERFRLKYPANWTVDKNTKSFVVNIVSQGAKASVAIANYPYTAGKNACDLLASYEKANTILNYNLIPKENQRATPEELKFVRATDSCIGVYKFVSQNSEFLCGVVLYVRGRKAIVLSQMVFASSKDEFADALGDIAKSFQFY